MPAEQDALHDPHAIAESALSFAEPGSRMATVSHAYLALEAELLAAQEREKALRETRDRLRFERDAARKREKALREKLAEWEKIGEEFESIANRDAETIARLLRRAGSPSEKPGSEEEA